MILLGLMQYLFSMNMLNSYKELHKEKWFRQDCLRKDVTKGLFCRSMDGWPGYPHFGIGSARI